MKPWYVAALCAAAVIVCAVLFGPAGLIFSASISAFGLVYAFRPEAQGRPVVWAAVATVVLFAAPALAQDGAIDVGGIFGAWRPYVVGLVSIAALAIVGYLAELLRRQFNLSIEAKHREALQTAVQNAAGLALNKLGNSLEGKKVDIGSPAIAEAINYAAKAAPDALKKFGLGPEDLRDKIVAKIPQIANTSAPPAPVAKT
jgi:hypothetical protein